MFYASTTKVVKLSLRYKKKEKKNLKGMAHSYFFNRKLIQKEKNMIKILIIMECLNSGMHILFYKLML